MRKREYKSDYKNEKIRKKHNQEDYIENKEL